MPTETLKTLPDGLRPFLSRHESRKRVISQEYASPWRDAQDDVLELIKYAATLDGALTEVCQERDDAFDEIDRLREALKPFAAAADFADEGEHDMVLTTRDLQIARAALKAEPV